MRSIGEACDYAHREKGVSPAKFLSALAQTELPDKFYDNMSYIELAECILQSSDTTTPKDELSTTPYQCGAMVVFAAWYTDSSIQHVLTNTPMSLISEHKTSMLEYANAVKGVLPD